LKTKLIEKTLSRNEISEIYEKYTKYDFPKDELKTLEHILKLYDKNIYLCKGFFLDNELKSYMFFAMSEKNHDCVLLDFFAVNPAYRNNRYGSGTIDIIKSVNPFKNGIIAEIEDPLYSQTEEEKTIRKKRALFYEKNGFIKTGVRSKCFGVNFLIIYLPFKKENTLSDQEIKIALADIYKSIFSKCNFEKNISISL